MTKPTIKSVKKRALWTLVGSFLLISAAQPTAYGLEFPMTTSLSLPASANLTTSIALNSEVDLSAGAALYTQLDKRSKLFASQMALAAAVSEQVEMARSIVGAKKVAKSIMFAEYAWGEDQFTCLNRLWTRESHWNYRARNKKSGAHGIPQALPASRMDVVSTDWRTNPVTQIRVDISPV